MAAAREQHTNNSQIPSKASLFARQTPLVDPQTSFAGKTVLVTGSNTGLGFEAAVKFAAHDADRVILAVRDLSKGNRAKASIEQRTGKHCIDVWQLDMSNYDSILEFVRRVEKELERLDVVILNAGVFMVKFEESRYGWEQTMQINALSTTLLGILLLPVLRKFREKSRSTPVMEFVSSWNYAKVELSPEQLEGEQSLLNSLNVAEGFVASKQYAASKLFVMCAMKSLALSAQSADGRPDVIVNAVCPGYCASNLSRGHQGILMDIIRWIANTLILRTTEEGARALVSGVTVGNGVHGKFWRDDEIKPEAPILDGENGEYLTKKVFDEIWKALKRDLPSIDFDIANHSRAD